MTAPDAFWLPRMNLKVRNTPRARALLTRAVAAKASVVGSSGNAGIFSLLAFARTIATKKQNREFNKMKSPIGSHARLVAAPCGQLMIRGWEG